VGAPSADAAIQPLIESGLPDQALVLIDQRLATDPDDLDLLTWRARALVGLGRHREAVALFHAITGRRADHLPAYLVYADAMFALDRPEAWVQVAAFALAADPSSPLAHLWAARSARAFGLHEPELTHLTESLRLQPRNPGALLALGTRRWQEGQIDQAADAFRQACEQGEGASEASTMLAFFQISTGRGQPDLDALEAQARQFPYRHLAYPLAGIFLRARPDLPRALALARLAVAASPETVNVHIRLGEILFALRAFDEAWSAFDDALDLQPRAARAHQGLGLIQLQDGDPEGAITSFRHALEREPSLPEATRGLREAEAAVAGNLDCRDPAEEAQVGLALRMTGRMVASGWRHPGQRCGLRSRRAPRGPRGEGGRTMVRPCGGMAVGEPHGPHDPAVGVVGRRGMAVAIPHNPPTPRWASWGAGGWPSRYPITPRPR
jgi:tetratricopeptide (TPR) repeat protein